MAERYFLGSGSRIIPPGWRRGPSGVCRYYRAGTYSSLYNSQSILYSTNQLPISLLVVSLSLSLSFALRRPFYTPSSCPPFSIPSSSFLARRERTREKERKGDREKETERKSGGYQTPTSFSSRPFFQHRGQIRARDGFYDLRSVSL